MILLDTVFTIYMTGLMTHIGDDRVGGPDLKTHVAVLVDRQHRQHRPIICVDGEHLYGGDEATPPYTAELRQGDRIMFEGLIAGRALASRAFEDYVPTLEEPITNALLHDKPRKDEIHDDVVASMKFPKGELGIAWYHQYQADFIRDNRIVRSQCVPEATRFTTNSSYTDKVTMRIVHTQGLPTEVDLEPDAVVALWNQPDAEDDQERETHFTNYIGVLKPRFMLGIRHVARVRAGDPCRLGPQRPTPLPMCSPTSLVDPEERHNGMTSAMHKAINVVIVLSDHPSCTNTDWP